MTANNPAVPQALIASVEEVKALFNPSIYAIQVFPEPDRPKHVGTAFAIEYKGRRFLVTAAHVVDSIQDGTLTVLPHPLQDMPARGPIVLEQFVVTSSFKDRAADIFDFAWCELEGEDTARIVCIPQHYLENVASPTTGTRLYTLIGFPASKNKPPRPGVRAARKITMARGPYTNAEDDDSHFVSRGMSPSTHFAVALQKHSIEDDGTVQNTIDHKGFSGGPAIYTGRNPTGSRTLPLAFQE